LQQSATRSRCPNSSSVRSTTRQTDVLHSTTITTAAGAAAAAAAGGGGVGVSCHATSDDPPTSSAFDSHSFHQVFCDFIAFSLVKMSFRLWIWQEG